MFEPREKGEEGKGRSLLSLGRALQEERDRVAARDQPVSDEAMDAAARHRLARSRREARSGPLMTALGSSDAPKPESQAPEMPAPPVPAEARAGDEPAPRAQPQAYDDRPNVEQQKLLARQAVHRAADLPARERRQGADDHWQPLIEPQIVVGRIANSKALIATTTIAGALLGVAIALSTPKKYGALSEVLIDPRDLKIVEREITTPGLPSDATLGIIENNGRILTSGPVLAKVVEKLNLTADPEFNGRGGSSLTSYLNPIALVRSILARSDGPDDTQLTTKAAASLADKVTVDRTGKTFILNVHVSTEDAEKSALVANTLVDEYIKYAQQLQSQTAGKATDELTARLEELRKGVEAAEDKVEAFKAENDIIDPQGRSIADEELIKLNDQLSIARARTLEIDAKAASARQLDVNSVVSGGLPEGTNSSVLTELRAQYASVKQAVDNAAVRLGPRHPQRQALEAQLAGARDQISGELRRIVSSMQVELKRAVELEQDLAARLAQLKVRRGGTSQDMVKLRELERDANSKRAVYESFLLRARETGEQRGLDTANISVISRAQPALESSGPSRAAIAGTGTVMGFLVGVGLAGLLGARDSLRSTAANGRRRRRRSSDDATQAVSPAAPMPPSTVSGVETSSTVGDDSRTGSAASNSLYSHPAGVGSMHPYSTPSTPADARPTYQPAPAEPARWHQSVAQPASPDRAPTSQDWQAASDRHSPATHNANVSYAPAGYDQSRDNLPPVQPMTPQDLESDESLRTSIAELRATVRECRDAIRILADKHARRFF